VGIIEKITLESIKNKSYKDFKSKQGYKVIKFLNLNPIEVFEGGLSICDSCNEADFNGYYISVLNRYYCEKCFKNFEKRTPFYKEDLVYEKHNYKNIIFKLDNSCKSIYELLTTTKTNNNDRTNKK